MRRQRSEVDIRYEQFLKRYKNRNPLAIMISNDYQAEYEDIYGTPELHAEWDIANRANRQRYEAEHG